MTVVSIRHARVVVAAALVTFLSVMTETRAWFVPPRAADAETRPEDGAARREGARRPGVAQLDAPERDGGDPLDDPEAARRKQFFGNMPGWPMPGGFPAMPMPGMPGQGAGGAAGAFAGAQGGGVVSGGAFHSFQSFGAFGTAGPNGVGQSFFQFHSTVPGAAAGQPPRQDDPRAGGQGRKNPAAARRGANPPGKATTRSAKPPSKDVSPKALERRQGRLPPAR